MSQAFYRKWRPLLWDQVVGQEHVVQTLRNAVAAERVAHAYLFAGPRGTGKTTTARLLAKAVNCLSANLANRPCNECAHCQAVNQGRFLDLIEIDAASNTSVEDVRDLREKINFSPNQGRYKVYIIDEVHMLSTAAFNALLKTLEEPPSHAIFILATTEVHKIPATVLSRCQRHEFRRIPVNEIVGYLKLLAEGEGIQVDEEAYLLVARQSTGSMRDAISLLDQLASCGKRVTLELTQSVLGTATSQVALEVLEAIIGRRSAEGLEAIHRALDAGSDPRQLARQIVDYLRNLLLVAMDNARQVEATVETHAQMARHAQALPITELLRITQIFNQVAAEMRSSWQPALPLEMAFVEAITPLSAPDKETPKPDPPHSHQPGVEKKHPAPARPSQPTRQAAGIEPIDPPPVSPAEDDFPADDSANKRLDDNWRAVLSLVRKRTPHLYGVLNSCKLRMLKNNTLTLGFSGDVLKSRAETPSNYEVIRAVMREVMGIEVLIRCRTISDSRSTPPQDVDSDGMVAAALRDLGGEIVDVQ